MATHTFMFIQHHKYRQFITLLIQVAMLACLLILPNAYAEHNSAELKPKKLLVLGDSLSAAYGIETEKGWVNLLAKHLKQLKPTYHVVNASISGETTAGALQRLPKLLDQYQPAIIIIELGGNDGLRGFPIQQFRQNLSKMIELSQAANAKVLLTGIRIPPNYGKRYTQLFFDSYNIIADNFNVTLVPFLLKGIATQPQLMQADRVHPTTAAQPQILQNVLPYLKAIL